MKVVVVETGGWGGLAHYTWNLCEALGQAGTQVLLLTHERYELDHLPRTFAVQRQFRSDRTYLSMVRDLIGNARMFGGTIIHFQSLLSARKDLFLMWKLRRAGQAIVMTAHNTLPHESQVGDSFTWRWLYRGADLVICHTRWSSHELRRVHGLAESRIMIIPHGNYLFFKPPSLPNAEAARVSLGLPVGDPVILAFGALRPYKGIQDLLVTFPDVLRAIPRARLVVAGPAGNDRGDYERLIRVSGVGDRIHFRPEYIPMDRVSHFFQAADVVAFPYRSIDQSGSLQLAMSYGKPVVVTAVGGFPEFLGSGEGGLVVPANDHASLAKALIALLSDPVARERMGRYNHERAKTALSWSRIASLTLNAYLAALSKKPGENGVVFNRGR